MANNPYVNKVQLADGTSLIDISDTTAVASDVAQGKYFYLPSGQKVQGTSSGGGGGSVTQDQDGFIVLPPDGGSSPSGGGLEYETGTWTPSEDIASYWISFTNTHTEAPYYYMIADAADGYFNTTNSNFFLIYCNHHQLTGVPIYESSATIHYGEVRTMNRAGSATSFTNGTISLTSPYTISDDNSTTSPRYWAKETGIKAYTNSSSRYWRTGRTYKWIAVWAPTT